MLHLVGQLDLACGRQIESALADAAGSRILVDLSRLDFIDCAGLSLLLRLRGRDSPLQVTATSPAVLRLFALVRNSEVLDVRDVPVEPGEPSTGEPRAGEPDVGR